MDWLRRNAGPVLYGTVFVLSISYFIWFATIYH